MYEAPGKIDKEAFDTETQTRSDFVLHKWQEDVMKFSNSSTERQVTRITILGGETFFQKYVVGYSVERLDQTYEYMQMLTMY